MKNKLLSSFFYFSIFFLFFLFFCDLFQEPGLFPTVIICAYLISCVFVISRSFLLSLWVVALGVNALKLGTYYKMQYLGSPIVSSDILLLTYVLRQPEMLSVYRVEAVFFLFIFIIFISSTIFMIQRKEIKKKYFIKASVIFLFLMGVGLKILEKYSFKQLSSNQLIDQRLSQYGALIYFLNTVFDLRASNFEKLIKSNESSISFLKRSKSFQQKTKLTQIKKPDVFVVLNESTFDPSIIDLNEKHINNFNFFKNSKHLLYHLPLNVQTFGGGTYISEFNFLTGLNVNDFPKFSVPLNFSIVPFVQKTLFSELKDNGYYTIVLYPVHGSFFAARKSYLKYGVDEFWDSDDLGIVSREWAVSDTFLFPYFYKKIDELRKVTSKPLFVMMLTMNNHGPHNKKEITGLLSKDIEKEKWAHPFSDYLLRFLDTIKAHQGFINRFIVGNNKRPAVLLSFGDHLPSFEGEIQKMPFLKNVDRPLYQTFFSIWSNTPLSDESLLDKKMDIYFLGGLILDLLKLNKSDYFKANSALRRICNSTLNGCDPKLYESYQNYIYNDLKVLR